jgi:hypothetical protein
LVLLYVYMTYLTPGSLSRKWFVLFGHQKQNHEMKNPFKIKVKKKEIKYIHTKINLRKSTRHTIYHLSLLLITIINLFLDEEGRGLHPWMVKIRKKKLWESSCAIALKYIYRRLWNQFNITPNQISYPSWFCQIMVTTTSIITLEPFCFRNDDILNLDCYLHLNFCLVGRFCSNLKYDWNIIVVKFNVLCFKWMESDEPKNKLKNKNWFQIVEHELQSIN